MYDKRYYLLPFQPILLRSGLFSSCKVPLELFHYVCLEKFGRFFGILKNEIEAKKKEHKEEKDDDLKEVYKEDILLLTVKLRALHEAYFNF